jgi:hypothetical protein
MALIEFLTAPRDDALDFGWPTQKALWEPNASKQSRKIVSGASMANGYSTKSAKVKNT